VSYTVLLARAAVRAKERLPLPARSRIEAALLALEDNPRPHNGRKLVDVDAWRLRVGDYRIVYRIEDDAQIVRVLWLGLRRDAYRP
jgi:mRNA interferase RelE/StbE